MRSFLAGIGGKVTVVLGPREALSATTVHAVPSEDSSILKPRGNPNPEISWGCMGAPLADTAAPVPPGTGDMN